MVLGLAVDIETVNPPGLNCSNGVVKINSDGSHTITPHDPKQVYTYIGGKYDPDIDATDCDRLLECLEPQQREIFLRTIAAALCLPLARLKMSRVKGLLCHGDGSNGKDTLRTALVAVLGRGVTGKSLKDFQVYDSGRKFPLAGLENSLCNWSSENADAVKLDKLQSLKQFITGDELTIEHKGRGEYPYKPEAIFLANCNVLPSISSDFSKLTLSQKEKFTELLTGVPCSDPLKAFRIGDKVAGNSPGELSYNWHGRIVEIHTSIGCKVDWQEREKVKGGRVLSALFCNLRKI